MFKIVNDGKILKLNYNNKFVKAGTKKDLKSFVEDTNSKPKEFRHKFHCLSNCTECCHQYVGITESELFKIKRALRKLNADDLERIKNQQRKENICPLLDIDNGTCSVYEARPDICKDFGHYTGALACSYNLDVKLDSVEDYFFSKIPNSEPIKGKLGVDFTWEKGLIRNQ